MGRSVFIIGAALFPFVFGAFVAWDANMGEWDELGRLVVGLSSPWLAFMAYILTE
jgi:hypothetical protein